MRYTCLPVNPWKITRVWALTFRFCIISEYANILDVLENRAKRQRAFETVLLTVTGTYLETGTRREPRSMMPDQRLDALLSNTKGIEQQLN